MEVERMDYEDSINTQFYNNSSDVDSDASSSTISLSSLEDSIKLINCVQDLPEIVIDNFDLNSILISRKTLPLCFFMTKCTPGKADTTLFRL